MLTLLSLLQLLSERVKRTKLTKMLNMIAMQGDQSTMASCYNRRFSTTYQSELLGHIVSVDYSGSFLLNNSGPSVPPDSGRSEESLVAVLAMQQMQDSLLVESKLKRRYQSMNEALVSLSHTLTLSFSLSFSIYLSLSFSLSL